MIEKHPSPTVCHIGRSTIQHTHPDLLRPEAIRAALIKGGIAPAADPIVRVLCTMRAMAEIASRKGGAA